MIAGAGVAGLEALLALRSHVGGTARIELLAPEVEFVYRPSEVAQAFGLGEVHRVALAQIATDQSAGLRCGALAAVDPAAATITTSDGEQLEYDYLLLAVGATAREAMPGAITFGAPGGREAFAEVLASVRAGEVSRLVFAAPSGVGWLMPLYELALLTAWLARRHEVPLTISICSPEDRPLEAFGAEASGVVERLLSESAIEFIRDDGPAGDADAIITLPVPEGPWIAGLPSDEHGFIPVDAHAAVKGLGRVYAAGDGTSFPIKQGGLAAQQADAAAAAIAAALGTAIAPEPFRPVLRGMLLTGDLPRFLRGAAGASEAAVGPLWWPPAKIAARHLAPYLAHTQLSASVLSDRPAEEESPENAVADERDAVDLLLELADANARRGSFSFALRCLQAAEDLGGPLPAEREAKRQDWLRQAVT
jgi:sulfide:quinone oxidoreductase